MDKIQIGLLGGIVFLSSCSTVKNVTEISEIDGEWNIENFCYIRNIPFCQIGYGTSLYWV